MNSNKRSLFTAIVAWGLFVPPAFAIVGGEEDTENRFSNVGTVVFAPPGSVPSPRFTGTLIHPRVFLTAGHATEQFLQNHPWPFTDCYVSFAPDVRHQDLWDWSEIEAVITHPDYEPNGYDPHRNDVAVIILKQPIYDLPLAELADEGSLTSCGRTACSVSRAKAERSLPLSAMAQPSTGPRQRRRPAMARAGSQKPNTSP